jgi:purine catabolism regulator
MAVTIGEILAIDTMHNVRVIAGRKGLTREIKWVTVLEVLDEMSSVQEGELLVTTAFGLESIPGLVDDLIPHLVKRKLAGIAIQTGYYLDVVPAGITRQCDEYDFPLLELDKRMVFSEITMAIAKRIISRQTEMLEYAGQIHDRLTQIILENKGLPAVAKVLAELVTSPVRILDSHYNLLTSSGLEETSAYIDPDNIRQEYEAIKKAKLLGTCAGPANLQAALPAEVPKQVLHPLKVGEETYGYLSVLADKNILKDLSLVAISSAATVCTLQILNEQAIWDAEESLKGDFIDDLLENNIANDEALSRRAKLLGLDPADKFRVLVLSVDRLSEIRMADDDALREIKKRLFSHIRFFLHSYRKPGLAKEKNNKIVICIKAKGEAEKAEIARFADALKRTAKQEIPPFTVSVGIGQAYRQLSKASASFREAEHALSIANRLRQEDSTLFYEGLGPYNVFSRVLDSNEMLYYYNRTVSPLVEYDAQHGSDLIVTLDTFHESNNRISEAAQRLFVHRHTLKYRLNRIHELTGLDPEDSQGQFQLQLGLIVARLLSKVGPATTNC